MDSVPQSFSLEEAEESAMELDDTATFPLLSLPLELIHHIVRCLDERPSSSNFPAGPSTDLLNLAAVNVFFYNHCRPLVWRSITFEAQLGAVRPEAWVYMRSLKSLAVIMRESRAVLGVRPKDEGLPLPADRTRSQDRPPSPLPIKAFSYASPRHIPIGREDDDLRIELEALLDVVRLLKESKVQVLFLHGSEDGVPKKLGAALLTAILDLDSLSALRMNQMYIKGKLDLIDEAKPMPHLRTLQVMHGASKLVDITRLAPNLESLLLWPHSRKFKDLGQIIADKLPTLRLLSLDAVFDTELILQLANKIETLTSSGISLPLEELFLEGKQTSHHRSTLLTALGKVPSLKRLALYHLLNARPQLLYEIHEAAPQLEALTLVLGDTSAPVQWPAPVDEYLSPLSKFPKLSFFAWDLRTPQISPTLGEPLKKRLELEYDTLSALGRAMPRLEEAVAITEDVSEGSYGYFASFDRLRGGAVRVQVKKDRATDFLVGFERWCVIADD